MENPVFWEFLYVDVILSTNTLNTVKTIITVFAGLNTLVKH